MLFISFHIRFAICRTDLLERRDLDMHVSSSYCLDQMFVLLDCDPLNDEKWLHIHCRLVPWTEYLALLLRCQAIPTHHDHVNRSA